MDTIVRDNKDVSLPHLPGTKKLTSLDVQHDAYQQRAITSPSAQRFPGLSQGEQLITLKSDTSNTSSRYRRRRSVV